MLRVTRIQMFRRLAFTLAGLVAMPLTAWAQDAASDANPSFIYASKRFGGSDLCLRPLFSDNVARRTQANQWVMDPAISPDGGRIAFVNYRSGAPRLCVANIDLTQEREILSSFDARSPSWSPDGASVVCTAFFNGNFEILSVSADGSNYRQLTQETHFDSDPSWSPDGERIAFTSNRTGAFRLYTMNPEGGDLRDLLGQDLIACVYPAYSPDSRKIAFGGRGANGTVQLFTVGSDGQGLTQITPDSRKQCSYPAWSPDGKYLAYVRFDHWANSNGPNQNPPDDKIGGDIMLYDLENKMHTQLTSSEGPIWGPRPAWLPLKTP